MWEIRPLRIDNIKQNFDIMKIKHDEQNYANIPVSARLPISIADAAPIIPNPAPTPNKIGGILKRFCRDPGLNRKFLRGLRAFTLRWCRRNMKRFSASDDISFETWIENTNYPRSRKEQLRKIYEEQVRRDFEQPSSKRFKRSTKVKSFVKDESYTDFKYPRLINSRSDDFKVFSGPIFDAIGKRLGERPEFVKYIPVRERPKYLYDRLRGGTKFFSSDYSSFEAHFSAPLMKNCEFVLYTYMCCAVPALKRKMDIIMKVLSGKNFIHFKDIVMWLVATRMSGEMNTSVGNGFSNLMINSYMAELHNCGKITICVEGDDGIMTFERPENAPTEEDFKRNGLIIKLISSDNLADLSFCGQVFDPDDGVVLTEPFDALVNAGYTRKIYVKASRPLKLQLLRARALSMLYQYNGCPMLTSFAARIVHLTRGQARLRKSIFKNTETFKSDLLREATSARITPVIPAVDAPCRILFHRLYGVDIPEQLAFESAMDGLQLDTEIECSQVVAYPKNNVLMFDRYLKPKHEEVDLSKVDARYVSYLDSFCDIPWDPRMRSKLIHRGGVWRV